MNKLQKLTLTAGIAALGIGMVGQAQAALVIDDWNVNVSASADDYSASNGGVVVARSAANGGSFWGARHNLYADLFSGDGSHTIDCANCQQGHGINDANTIGNGGWSWTGGPEDMSGNVSLFYDADVAGGDIVATFVGTTMQEFWWSDLTAGAQTLTGSINVAQVTDIYLEWVSVGGNYDPSLHGGANYTTFGGQLTASRDWGAEAGSLDVNVDDLQMQIPEPATIALMGLGIAGLGWRRARR